MVTIPYVFYLEITDYDYITVHYDYTIDNFFFVLVFLDNYLLDNKTLKDFFKEILGIGVNDKWLGEIKCGNEFWTLGQACNFDFVAKKILENKKYKNLLQDYFREYAIDKYNIIKGE